MSTLSEKVKSGLDWLQHGYLLVQIFLSLGLGKAVEALLLKFTHIPTQWIASAWLSSAALAMWLLVVAGNRAGRKTHARQQSLTAQMAASPTIAPELPHVAPQPIDLKIFFNAAYSGQLQDQMEANVRLTFPSLRDGTVVKFIAMGIINALYDSVWNTVYRSQVLALSELNKRVLRREEIKPYYDNAVKQFPLIYKSYPFDAWLAWMAKNVLVIESPGQIFAITVRGQDFLKYMLHCHYAPELRAG